MDNILTAPWPHLSKAPIVEGLIDIQVRPRDGAKLDDLASLRDQLKSEYPESKEIKLFQSDIQISENNQTSHTVASQPIGYRVERMTPPFVLLLKSNGLTVSRLKPYEDWENLLSQAKLIWAKYMEVCKPAGITRIATRFINRVDLPIDGLDFDEYLAAPPKIPAGLPNVLVEFLVRLVIPQREAGSNVVLTQALESVNPDNKSVSVLIDIDAFKSIELEASSEQLWAHFHELRDIKNQTFFCSITQKTLELLK